MPLCRGTRTNYDALDRLTSAKGIWGSAAYAYDPLNNIRTLTEGGLTRTYAYDTTQTWHLTGTWNGGTQIHSFVYDSRGNTIEKDNIERDFDQANRLTQVPGLETYSYDAAGRRVKLLTDSGSTTYNMYDQGGRFIMQYRPGTPNATVTDYLYLGSHWIGRIAHVTSDAVSYEYTDALGSPMGRIDTSDVLTRYDYRPYGTQISGPNNVGPGFTGHVNDPDTGLVYMQQRYYDPEVGRFLSVDPVGPSPGNTFNFSRYDYANNNPLSYIDPTGTTCRRVKDGYKCKVDGNDGKFTKSEIKRINDAYTKVVNQLLGHPFRTVTVSLQGIAFRVTAGEVADALIGATIKTGYGGPNERAGTLGGLASKYINFINHGNAITTIYHRSLETNRNGGYFINIDSDLMRTFAHEGIHETSNDAFMGPLFNNGNGPFNSIHNSVYNQAGDSLLQNYGPIYAPLSQ